MPLVYFTSIGSAEVAGAKILERTIYFMNDFVSTINWTVIGLVLCFCFYE